MIDTPTLEPAAAYALWAEDYPPYAHNPLMQAEELRSWLAALAIFVAAAIAFPLAMMRAADDNAAALPASTTAGPPGSS